MVIERQEILTRLEKQLCSEASDEEIMQTINEGRKLCDRCIAIGRRELMDLISSHVMEQLVVKGFLKSDKFMVQTRDRKGSMADMIDQMKAEIDDLTEDQIMKLDLITERHFKKLEILDKERAELAQKLTRYFSPGKFITTGGEVSPSNLMEPRSNIVGKLDVVRSAGLLEHLRQSLHSEANEWFDTLMECLDGTMTPRQIAKFYLYCEFQYANVQQLSLFWSALSKEWENNARVWT